MSFIGLKHPELLEIRDVNESGSGNGTIVTGGSQYWYPSDGYIPNGACGATAASNILGYLIMTRKPLFDIACEKGFMDLSVTKGPAGNDGEPIPKPDFLEFMKKVYEFLYPHAGGLMADGFVDGISGLAKKYDLPIAAECLKITINRKLRPSFEEVTAFIKTSIKTDIPVAFLILSKGNVSALDTWHWVTILGFEEESGSVQITDNGKVFFAELSPWLDTSIMGGALVRISPSGLFSAVDDSET